MGRNTWKKLGEIPGVPSYRDTDVEHGRKYCYRIRAVTAKGTSEVMETDEMQAGTIGEPNGYIRDICQVGSPNPQGRNRG